MTSQKKKYEVFHPDHEVMVHTMLNMKDAINSEHFSELFEQAGFSDKNPEEWIPMQDVLNIFNGLEERGGASLDFVAIGMRVVANLEYPPEFMELPFTAQLATAGSQYPYFHRGTNVGYVADENITSQHVAYHVSTAFPDDFWYGLLYGLAKRFLPTKMAFKVYYDKEKLRREQGGEETIIHVEWWEKGAY